MEQKQNEGQWFLIKHEKCGSTFVVNSKITQESYEKIRLEKLTPNIECPSCREYFYDHHQLKLYFDAYEKFIEELNNRGFIMMEIPDEIDCENLEFY